MYNSMYLNFMEKKKLIPYNFKRTRKENKKFSIDRHSPLFSFNLNFSDFFNSIVKINTQQIRPQS